MTCAECGSGRTLPGTTVHVYIDDRTGPTTVLVVRNVPAIVCDGCGSALYAETTASHLLRILQRQLSESSHVATVDFAPEYQALAS